MGEICIAALFETLAAARRAVQALEVSGIPDGRISLLAGREAADPGVGAGATIGSLLGGAGGLLAGLGILALPGIGPVAAAGPLVATLTGAGVGAAAGGLLGALIGLGIGEEAARHYLDGVRRGGALVTLALEPAQAAEAARLLAEHRPIRLEQHAASGGAAARPEPARPDGASKDAEISE